MDDDGDIDIITAWKNKIVVWNNQDNISFIRVDIVTNFNDAMSVYATDMDEDGDIDIIGSARTSDKISWFENNNGSFTENLVGDFDDATDAYPIDLDKDNDMDVLGVNFKVGGEISWFENDGNQDFTKHVIDTFNLAWKVAAADLDDDGDLDVLGTSYWRNKLAWWENNGNGNFTKYDIDRYSACSISAIDMNKDGNIDILCPGFNYNDNDIAWFENDGNGNFTKHIIATNFTSASSAIPSDFDNDTDLDVLGISWYDWEIAWFENLMAAHHNVGVVSIDIPGLVPQDTTFNLKATFKNFGTEPESFPVGCMIDPAGYLDIQTVSNLEVGDSIQITFAPFAFISGTYLVDVYTQLTNDEFSGNNYLEKTVQTYDPGITDGGSILVFSFNLKNNPTAKALFNLALPQDALITLKVYDVSGRLINKVSGHKSAGYYQIPWMKANAGVYFYIFESLGHKETGKLVIIN